MTIRSDKRWGVCPCGKWGEAPANFNESKHFLKCECGQLMYLDMFDPREAAYPEKDHITTITVVKQ
jgi:hypothetical protein